jgi:hypothetical protein
MSKVSGRRIGQRVRIAADGGMPVFWGKTGRIISEEMGMYRVRLDEPVEITGLGRVSSDLWESSLLRRCR